MSELIKVGMADFKTGKSPANLISYGLGSCVGITMWDPVTKVGGMAHIMLPSASAARATDNQAKFADTCLPLMLEQVIKLGAVKSRLQTKIAGGSQMFAAVNATDVMKVGERNVEAVRGVLSKLGLRIMAEDVGGNYGRTVELNLEDGKYKIKTAAAGEKIL